MRFSQEQTQVREGELQGKMIRLERLHEAEPLFVALVIDRSEYAAGHPFPDETSAGPSVLDHVKEATGELFDLIRAGNDSVMLVAYSGEVDLITDMNREVGVFSLIINDLEARGGAAFFNAIQAAMEGLSVHKGMKHVIAFSHGPDTHSRQTSASQVAAYAQAQGVHLHVLSTIETDHNALKTLTHDTGGSFRVIRSAREMSGYLRALFRSMREQYELAYLSPTPAREAEVHPLRIDVWQESQLVAKLQAAYRPGTMGVIAAGDLGGGRNLLFWGGIALALVLGAGGIYALFMYVRDRIEAAPVIPVILELTYDTKRDLLRVRYNVPNRSKPAKFTIYSESGAPVKDAVFAGRKTRAFIDISDIPDGHYVCDISNSGIVSETRKMTWHNP